MRILSLLFCLSIVSQSFYSQGIDFNRISAGINLNYLISEGDMGQYWKKPLTVGLKAGYLLRNSFSLEGELSYAKFKPENEATNYPLINLILMSGGLKYNLNLSRHFQLTLKPGIENTMFIFSGPSADLIYEQNKNESEFGFFLSSGIQIVIWKDIKLELNLKVLNILSSPESIIFYAPGLTLFIL